MVAGGRCPSILLHSAKCICLDLDSETDFINHRSNIHVIVITEAFLSFYIGRIEFLTWKVCVSPFCDRKEGRNGYMSESF